MYHKKGPENFVYACLLQASKLKKVSTFCKNSRSNLQILRLLQRFGYIYGFFQCGLNIQIFLKYDFYGDALVQSIKIFSTPSKPKYITWKSLLRFSKKSNVFFISTTKGILSNKEAINKKLGGKLLFGLQGL